MKYMTKEWYDVMQKSGRPPFPEELERQVKMTMAAYYDEYKKNFPTPPKFMDTVGRLHDCELISAELIGNDFIIKTDLIEWGSDDYVKIIFKNAVLKKKDFGNQGLAWSYEELYIAPKGYELHVLLREYSSGKLYELIVECENIEIKKIKNAEE